MSHALKIKKLEARVKELEAETGASHEEVMNAVVDWFEGRSSKYQKDHGKVFKPVYKALDRKPA